MIEGAAGFGKSVLAAECRSTLGSACAWVALGPPDDDVALLISSVDRSFRAANLSDLSSVLGSVEPRKWADHFLDALISLDEPLMVVFDDAHHLRSQGATRVLLRLAQGMPRHHRMLVTARRLPPGLDLLRTASRARLVGAEDLAFDPDEAASLVEMFLARPIDVEEQRAVMETAGGWASALVLVAGALGSRSGVGSLPAAPARAVIASLLDARLHTLSAADQRTLCQMAHVPYFSPELSAMLSGDPETFGRIVESGVPMLRTVAGRWELPDPVASRLANSTRLSPDAATVAAHLYSRDGDARTAVRMLASNGLHEQVASLVAGLGAGGAEELGWAEIRNAVEGLPDEVVARWPRTLLHLVRTAGTSYRPDLCRAALERAAVYLAGPQADQAVLRELHAEQALDLVTDERRRDRARSLAESVINGAGPEDSLARCRALEALGRLRSWWSQDGPHEDAGPLLEEASRIALRVGQPAWAARALASLAMGVHFGLCRYQRALATLDRTIALLPARNPYQGYVLGFRVTVLCALARYEEAESTLAEMRGVAHAAREEWLLAYASWSEEELASFVGDRPRAVRAATEVYQHRDAWFEGSAGVEFLAQGADFLDRVGEHDMAVDLLSQAKQRMEGFERVVWVYEASVLGRSGDPAHAEEVLALTLRRSDLDPQERWPLMLLRAYAASRRGDRAAGCLAAEAFEVCRELGIADAPLLREPAVADALLPLAVSARSAAAVALTATHTGVSLSVLGGFEVRRGLQVLHPPGGRPSEAIRAVAAAGGAMQVDELIELLWPDTDPDTGRNRLKNLLSRLRMAVGDVLVRDENTVSLAAGTRCDADSFETDGRRALRAHSGGETLEAAALARAAVNRFRGELLPADRYADWAAEPRERLRLLYLELLDLLAGYAESGGDVDEAIRLVERAIDFEPHDERRYVKLASLLASQGRVGTARTVLDRARARLDDLGLSPSAELATLELSAGVAHPQVHE